MALNYDKIKIGRRIKELRNSKLLSQDALCDRGLDINPDYLSKLENGNYAPSVILLQKIMNALEVTPDVFFDCEHLADENELDQLVMQEYNSLPLKKKRLFYRQIQILKEFN